MGKNKKEKKDGDEKSQHSAATVCVSGLPYSFTNAQLEEAFSDVAPVRLCFMVTNKGSNEHRGFAFVKFALPEDANHNIELKNVLEWEKCGTEKEISETIKALEWEIDISRLYEGLEQNTNYRLVSMVGYGEEEEEEHTCIAYENNWWVNLRR